jgi:hypothetical protein
MWEEADGARMKGGSEEAPPASLCGRALGSEVDPDSPDDNWRGGGASRAVRALEKRNEVRL